MGLLQIDQLKKLIPMLEENVSMAKALLEKDPGNKDLESLLKQQERTLEEYRKRVNA